MNLNQGLSNSPILGGAPTHSLGIDGYNPHLVYSLRDIYGTGGAVIKCVNASGDVRDFTAPEIYDGVNNTPSALNTFREGATSVNIDTIYQQNPNVSGGHLTQSTASEQVKLSFASTGWFIAKTGSQHMNIGIPSAAQSALADDITFMITGKNTGIQFNTNLNSIFCINDLQGTGGSIRGLVLNSAFTTTLKHYNQGGTTNVSRTIGASSGNSDTIFLRSEGNSNGNNLRSSFTNGSQSGGQQTDETTDVGTYATFTDLGLFQLPASGSTVGNTNANSHWLEFIIFAKYLTDAEVGELEELLTFDNRDLTT